MDFELDVNQQVSEHVKITDSAGAVHVFDVLPLTKQRMLQFQEFDQQARELRADDFDIEASGQMAIKSVAVLLGSQNGGPSAEEFLLGLWDDGVLGMGALQRLGEFLQEKAGSSPPA